jgi:protein-tyrosine-phosphatase
MSRVYNALFLCTGNSARSIMAEVILRRWGQGRFHSFSAGSHPRGKIHPLTIEMLERMHHSTAGLRSKDWSEFAQPGSPPLDFVFTVCDQAAGEVCPAWPGQPMTAHWGVEDPAAFEGSIDKQRAIFKRVYLQLDARIKIFSSLRIEKLDRLSLQKNLDDIGRSRLAEGEFPRTA